MLFPDFRQGLSELLRVTRPDGTVFLVTFGPVRKVGYLGLFVSAVWAVKPAYGTFPPEIVPLPFQVSVEGTLERKMTEAGLRHVREGRVAHSISLRTGGG